jgi:hypothetical protein
MLRGDESKAKHALPDEREDTVLSIKLSIPRKLGAGANTAQLV